MKLRSSAGDDGDKTDACQLRSMRFLAFQEAAERGAGKRPEGSSTFKFIPICEICDMIRL